MAGSYNHILTDHGNLASPERVNGMLENGGDVYEAVEEMYGMIWWLAHTSNLDVTPKDVVEMARQNYTEGLKLAKATKDKVKPNGG